jgi:predicted dithiol-disulfide oxidoreductase (DUF899 family)
MTDTVQSTLPPIVSRGEWQTARDLLLTREKEHIRTGDALAADRRNLPMVELDSYEFEGADGKRSLVDLFEDRTDMIVHHFMFDPTWDKGCPHCTGHAKSFPQLSQFVDHKLGIIRVSRAPYPKIAAYNELMGWDIPWYSSFGTTFNQDIGVTVDDEESPGTSVLMRDGDRVFHTYITTDRGVESQVGIFGYLDLTPHGRRQK